MEKDRMESLVFYCSMHPPMKLLSYSEIKERERITWTESTLNEE